MGTFRTEELISPFEPRPGLALYRKKKKQANKKNYQQNKKIEEGEEFGWPDLNYIQFEPNIKIDPSALCLAFTFVKKEEKRSGKT